MDHSADDLKDIVEAIRSGEDLAHPEAPDERFAASVGALRRHAAVELPKSYGAAELEDLVQRVLEALYTNASITKTAGPAEQGIDLLVAVADRLGIDAKVGVQVKCHTGVESQLHSLHQIELAAQAHEITAGVVITTADAMSPEFAEHREKLEAKVGIPIRVILRDEFLDLPLTSLHIPRGRERQRDRRSW